MIRKIETVFLDMDGVLTNFNKSVCKEFDLPYPPQVYHFFPSIRKEVNTYCTFDFWKNLEWMEDGRDILKAIMDTFGLEKVYLLTKVMPNVQSASGKMMWIQNNLPVYYDRAIITTLAVPKSLLARPDALLIDDNDKYLDGFIEGGGQGLLVPRLWNRDKIWANETAKIVRRKLEELL